MKFSLAIDIISDLNLKDSESFDWEGKPTSLFCVIAGNLSSDIEVIKSVLEKLSQLYRGVFYIDGYLENLSINEHLNTVQQIKELCELHNNVIYLHNHVVVLNGVALVAINGWDKSKYLPIELDDDLTIIKNRVTDISYVKHTMRKLNDHRETKKVIMISSSVPDKELLLSGDTANITNEFELCEILNHDTNLKISTWIFGGSNLLIDSQLNSRRFVNNPKIDGQPYWPKRIEI